MNNSTNAVVVTITPSPTNSTNINTTRFIILESAVSVFTVILLYLIVSFLIYELKKPSSTLCTLVRRSKQTDQTLRYGLAMRIELIIAMVFLLGRFGIEHYELLSQYLVGEFDYCDEVTKLKILMTTINVAAVYLFLWTRQRFCYAKPAMRHLSSTSTRVTSWISLVLLFLAHAVATALFFTTRTFSKAPQGCVAMQTGVIPLAVAWIWVAVVSFIFQVLLTALFIYPLIRHKLMTGHRPGFHNFIPLIKRTTFATVVCIVTDLLSSLLILSANDSDGIIPTLAYDISALTNVIIVLVSFGDWKMQLFAPFICCAKDDESWKSSNDSSKQPQITPQASSELKN